MNAPALQKDGRRSTWEIADSGVVVCRQAATWENRNPAWQLRALSRPAITWLRANNLDEATFCTRREAVRTVTAVAASRPLPYRSPGPPLTRVRAGQYRTRCGVWTVTRRRSGWIIEGPARIARGWVPTLREARRKLPT